MCGWITFWVLVRVCRIDGEGVNSDNELSLRWHPDEDLNTVLSLSLSLSLSLVRARALSFSLSLFLFLSRSFSFFSLSLSPPLSLSRARSLALARVHMYLCARVRTKTYAHTHARKTHSMRHTHNAHARPHTQVGLRLAASPAQRSISRAVYAAEYEKSLVECMGGSDGKHSQKCSRSSNIG